MKTEVSAGGVIVCPVHNQWYILILKDRSGAWTFPKGIVEKGEKPESAAMREIREEVGISVLTLIAALTPIQYFYTRGGSIKKTVNYFMFQLKIRRRPAVQIAEGISAARWVSIDRAIGMIGYRETNVRLLEEAWKLLKQQTYKK